MQYSTGGMGFELYHGYSGFKGRAPTVKFVSRFQEMVLALRRPGHISPKSSRVVAVDGPRALAVMREGFGRDALRTIFNDLGWKLTIAGTPAAAVARHRESPFPIILYERELTGCDWRLLVSLFGRLSPPPSVILLSPSADRNLWDEVIRCGGSDILRMPFDRDAVMRAVRAGWTLWRSQQNVRQAITPLRTA